VSPGTAALIAAWTSPPDGTTIVAARASEAEINKVEMMMKALASLGELQHRAARNWEIRTFFSVQ